jgi:hypothetical protein
MAPDSISWSRSKLWTSVVSSLPLMHGMISWHWRWSSGRTRKSRRASFVCFTKVRLRVESKSHSVTHAYVVSSRTRLGSAFQAAASRSAQTACTRGRRLAGNAVVLDDHRGAAAALERRGRVGRRPVAGELVEVGDGADQIVGRRRALSLEPMQVAPPGAAPPRSRGHAPDHGTRLPQALRDLRPARADESIASLGVVEGARRDTPRFGLVPEVLDPRGPRDAG